ncbi:hypothetical protein ANN_11737 [Periplaneta americana]|uniref:Uncharacterized protein n=1 Tax=Periplaneta americana TaxID=6978 RepID=A0ABQ8T7N6_PERAM|nr:hypothetical protein ANN_11737 [Periplaneta americana]
MPSTWPGIEPATLDIEGQRYINSPTCSYKVDVRSSFVGHIPDSRPQTTYFKLTCNRGRAVDVISEFDVADEKDRLRHESESRGYHGLVMVILTIA